MSDEKKDDIIYVEDAATRVDTVDERDPVKDDVNGLVKSRYASLSVTQAIWKFKLAAFYCFLTFTAGIMTSYELNMAGSIIANAGFMQQFGVLQPDGTYVINTTWASAWGAIINVGQIVAMTHTPYVADRWGRRAALTLGALYCLVALVFCTVARTPAVWLIGKLLMGVGIGMQQVVATPYVIEVSPDVCRGALNALGGIWGGLGGVGSTVMMQVLNQNHPYNWLLMVYLEYPFVVMMVLAYAVIPETPWYYGRRADKRGGIRNMKRLYRNVKDYDYEEEWGIILRTVEHERQMLAVVKATPWTDCFKGLNGKRMMILAVMCTGQQVGGNALIGTYSTYFFQFAGLTDPFLGSMIQSIIGLVTSVFYTLTIDKVGRRLLSNISYTVVTVCLVLMGAVWYAHTDAAGQVLLGLVCIYTPFWGMYTSTYPILAAELPSVQLRMKTGTIVWFYQALWGILCCFAVPPLLTLWNVRAAFLFAGLSVPVTIYLWIYLPETKARSIAEVDELFERGIPAWRWSKTVTDAQLGLKATQEAEAAADAAAAGVRVAPQTV